MCLLVGKGPPLACLTPIPASSEAASGERLHCTGAVAVHPVWLQRAEGGRRRRQSSPETDQQQWSWRWYCRLDFGFSDMQNTKSESRWSALFDLSVTLSVTSPLLYTLHTNDCCTTFENHHISFADDTVIVSLLNRTETSQGPVVDYFLKWCQGSFLSLNVSKTMCM